jgi:hypothetical protein
MPVMTTPMTATRAARAEQVLELRKIEKEEVNQATAGLHLCSQQRDGQHNRWHIGGETLQEANTGENDDSEGATSEGKLLANRQIVRK